MSVKFQLFRIKSAKASSKNKDNEKQKVDKLHKFETKEKSTIKSPKKPLLKSKEEGQILGLPQQEDHKSDQNDNLDDEPSIYFYEDDEEELENLVTKWMPVLNHMMTQINSFWLYNGSKEFQNENNYHHTYIMQSKFRLLLIWFKHRWQRKWS